jgi:hypothetical protein
MAKKNQGFRQDLNFQENINDTQALSNLGGVGLAADLKIIQNNLRNTSTISFDSFTANNSNFPDSTGFFTFPNREFVFSKDDVVTVSKDVSVGSTTLFAGTDYFVTNSNVETQFKLSFTSSVVGVSTVIVNSVSPTDFNFIRKDPVLKENLVAFLEPDIQDDENFGSYLSGGINDIFDSTQANQESSIFFITKKYKGTEDTTVNQDIKFEGTLNLFDPDNFNTNPGILTDPKSPGIFIGNTRAFSTDNNPWVVDGDTLRTDSTEVSIGELEIQGDVEITGLSADNITGISSAATAYQFKIPVTVNGETYYLLMHD